MNISIADVDKHLKPIVDNRMEQMKKDWFEKPQQLSTIQDFLTLADGWWKSSSRNSLKGWEKFSCIDYTLGCGHFISSTADKLRWNVQVLPEEYAYYKLMGIQQTNLGELEPNVPLFISIPGWKYADLHPQWQDILIECEQKNIDIHLDFAWLIVSNGIHLDLDHPCIKSFGMSFSKYNMNWNRCGVRWCRQRTMDDITIQNHYYVNTNQNITSACVHLMNNIPRDYVWDTYGDLYLEVCNYLSLEPTATIHTARLDGKVVGVGNILQKLL